MPISWDGTLYRVGPETDSCGTPDVTGKRSKISETAYIVSVFEEAVNSFMMGIRS